MNDATIIFLGCVAVIAVSIWMVFFKARIPIPQDLPRGVTRFTLEVINDWLRLFGGLTGCVGLPLAIALGLAVLSGGMTPWHFVGAMLMFVLMIVWRMR
jgi:hypothetical protein